MIDSRLSLALGGGGLVWPSQGTIAVFHPQPDAQLAGLPMDRTLIIVDTKPDFDLWSRRGYLCTVEAAGPFAAALVALPRSKSHARALIARAVQTTSGLLVIDGQKTDGVDSLLREMRSRVAVKGPVVKAHGKMFWTDPAAPSDFDDWVAAPALTPGGFWTAPGVFSAEGIDPASALLTEALPEQLGKRVADLGAGWGFLSAHVLTRAEVENIHLVEASHIALECARHNVTDPRAQFHWADATTWQPQDRMDTVVINPPFHLTRDADPGLGQAFVQAAARILQPQGQLWMVANRHLPYEASLQAGFATWSEIAGDRRFKLIHAARPLRKRVRLGLD